MKNPLKQRPVASQNSLILLTLLLSFILLSCAGVGYMVGGAMQNYQGKYSIELTTEHSDILDIVSDVGKSMSLDVAAIDQSKGEITIATGSSASVLTGKSKSQTIQVKATEGGKRLDVNIFVTGNFGAGTKEAGDELFSEFKMKLHEKTQ